MGILQEIEDHGVGNDAEEDKEEEEKEEEEQEEEEEEMAVDEWWKEFRKGKAVKVWWRKERTWHDGWVFRTHFSAGGSVDVLYPNISEETRFSEKPETRTYKW